MMRQMLGVIVPVIPRSGCSRRDCSAMFKLFRSEDKNQKFLVCIMPMLPAIGVVVEYGAARRLSRT